VRRASVTAALESGQRERLRRRAVLQATGAHPLYRLTDEHAAAVASASGPAALAKGSGWIDSADALSSLQTLLSGELLGGEDAARQARQLLARTDDVEETQNVPMVHERRLALLVLSSRPPARVGCLQDTSRLAATAFGDASGSGNVISSSFLSVSTQGKHPPPQGRAPHSLTWTLRFAREIMASKTAQDGILRSPVAVSSHLSDHLYDVLARKYGLRPLVDQQVWDVLRACQRWRGTCPEIELFARMLEESTTLYQTGHIHPVRAHTDPPRTGTRFGGAPGATASRPQSASMQAAAGLPAADESKKSHTVDLFSHSNLFHTTSSAGPPPRPRTAGTDTVLGHADALPATSKATTAAAAAAERIRAYVESQSAVNGPLITYSSPAMVPLALPAGSASVAAPPPDSAAGQLVSVDGERALEVICAVFGGLGWAPASLQEQLAMGDGCVDPPGRRWSPPQFADAASAGAYFVAACWRDLIASQELAPAASSPLSPGDPEAEQALRMRLFSCVDVTDAGQALLRAQLRVPSDTLCLRVAETILAYERGLSAHLARFFLEVARPLEGSAATVLSWTDLPGLLQRLGGTALCGPCQNASQPCRHRLLRVFCAAAGLSPPAAQLLAASSAADELIGSCLTSAAESAITPHPAPLTDRKKALVAQWLLRPVLFLPLLASLLEDGCGSITSDLSQALPEPSAAPLARSLLPAFPLPSGVAEADGGTQRAEQYRQEVGMSATLVLQPAGATEALAAAEADEAAEQATIRSHERRTFSKSVSQAVSERSDVPSFRIQTGAFGATPSSLSSPRNPRAPTEPQSAHNLSNRIASLVEASPALAPSQLLVDRARAGDAAGATLLSASAIATTLQQLEARDGPECVSARLKDSASTHLQALLEILEAINDAPDS
jgi:hypothetical protein